MKLIVIQKIIIILLTIIIGFVLSMQLYNFLHINKKPLTITTTTTTKPKIIKEKITLSFAGDCTLGTDTSFGYNRSFNYVFDKNNKDFGYFFRNVKDIFDKDDYSIVNLETTLTTSNIKNPIKTFNFKGDPSYTNIIKQGNIEIVNIANNHIYDYLDKGYNDTIENLTNANIEYYGYEHYLIKEIKGIKIGLAGFTRIGSLQHTNTDVQKALKYFIENNVDIKIITFHWGMELEYKHNYIQENLAKGAIDGGADLVVGHHPHVVQGIQKYNNKYIIYSLGNFSFGGNSNPWDKDAFIFQISYNIEDKKLLNNTIKIIPVSITSVKGYNNYQPTPYTKDTDINRVINKINKNSKDYKYDTK